MGRKKGKEGGTFRAMLDQIRQGHSIGQSLRAAMFAAGLLTDRNCYAEVLVQFYLATRSLEKRMDDESTKDNGAGFLAPLNALKFRFTADYEKDLSILLGNTWPSRCQELASPPARAYETAIAEGNEESVAAAAFILWGPLVIGGGPGLRRRIAKAFGNEVTNVFNQITGVDLARMKEAFIACFDDLVQDGDDVRRSQLVDGAGRFMELNNELMRSVKVQPWWLKRLYQVAGFVVLASAGIALWRQRSGRVKLLAS